MKILALNLPQFHRIKENDEWWGEGFTEWTNVKKALPLYKGHIQPKIPINNYYYDLSKIETIQNQANLAKKYGVDGFVYYHYWFNGKKLLERPCEMLLENKHINIEYAFCWANEPWARTWDGKDTDVIMAQEYGNKDDWEKHIKYLIPFFKDERYIKVEGKPMIYIYSPCQIPNFDEMIELWNRILKENELDEIYLVEYICSKNPTPYSKYSKAILEFEPMYTNRFQINNFQKIKRKICKELKIIDFANYDKTWKKILSNKKIYDNKKIQKGCFCSWDNSPRKGKAATIFKNSSPEKFGKYLKQLINTKRINAEDNIIVINAWNEWGEGANLEPTEQDGYKYLEQVKKVKEEYISENNYK